MLMLMIRVAVAMRVRMAGAVSMHMAVKDDFQALVKSAGDAAQGR
jgi:hypothetical protein